MVGVVADPTNLQILQIRDSCLLFRDPVYLHSTTEPEPGESQHLWAWSPPISSTCCILADPYGILEAGAQA